MKVLLIWEEIPEDTKLYLINDPTEEQLKMLEGACNKYINFDDITEAMDYLSAALTEEKYKNDPDIISSVKDKSVISIWSKCKVTAPINQQIDKVFISGFYL